MGYELLDHTADVGLRAWSPTLEGLFAECGSAVIGIMGEGRGSEECVETVSLDAPDLDALLVDWLSELLFLFEARAIVPTAFDVRIDRDGCRLEASVRGPSTDGFEQGGPQVKAVTFHGLELREADGWQAWVYVDV